MISFKQFLREADDSQDAREFFHREAAPFIDQAEGAGVLVRGTHHSPPVYKTVTLPSGKEITVHRMEVRKDRKPMDMPREAHEIADKFMKDKFGIAGRSGTAFVVGAVNSELAAGYGDLYAVIPQGEFRYIWSPKTMDLYDYFEYTGFDGRARGMETPEKISMWREELEGMKYQDTDLPRAIRSGFEVMLECDHLLLVRVDDDEILDELYKVLR
ncbi:hypothetical protein [Janthinobacterium sp.]|uniref:hypothetical protein n=1 Tax=Janthinobacterium sp. TaxID=1871054 RepID=UPI002608BF44|nr:hypothetical protein [Janthinobacterium sp.]